MYLCFSSRKLQKPLHVISLGSSGSGKTHLQEAISALMPEEEVINVTSLSDQALYYYPEGQFKAQTILGGGFGRYGRRRAVRIERAKKQGKFEQVSTRKG